MSQPFLLSVRAIEDIIGITKAGENPRLTCLNEIEEVVYSANTFDSNYSFAEENDLSSLQEFKTVESYPELSQKLVKSGSEGDYSIRNSSENIRYSGGIDSEADLRSWPSDSDITVLRMKKEFRNELSAKMDWEEERRLTDTSSHNLDWESHSMINLADVIKQNKDQAEGLTPFTIWAKGNAETTRPDSDENGSVEQKNITEEEIAVRDFQEKQETDVLKADSIDATAAVEAIKPDSEQNQKEDAVSRPSKSKLIQGFFRSLFRCGSKRQESLDEINTS